MGKRGPKRIPTSELLLRGSKRGKARQRREIKDVEGIPICPSWLGKGGKAKWRERVSILCQTYGLLTKIDGDRLALYCEAYEEFLDARKYIELNGPTCLSKNGSAYQRPAVGRKNKAIERMCKIGSVFGISPADRAGLDLGKGTNVKDPLIELLQRRSDN